VLLLLICATLLGSSGCAFSRGNFESPLNETDISQIKAGQTREAEVVAILGAPESVEEINDRPVFHYFHYGLKHGTVLVFSRINVASDDVYVFFDEDGVVSQVLQGNRTKHLKFQWWPFGDSGAQQ
jgi:outer membrane protein assembly factor BamE (lipoprotein component of BamABCDE complex)